MSLNIALIGPGLVGKEFLNQIKQFQQTASKIKLNVIGVMSSKFMKLSSTSLPDYELNEGMTASLDQFIQHAKQHSPCVIVDCTSSDDITKYYPTILENTHLVTPNKKGFSGSLELYQKIIASSHLFQTFVLHESTVGAGLPIISTLQDLVKSGDEILKIEVMQAKNLGYTEPDPRDDLNGMDVARKVVILGRVAGLNLCTETLQVQNIVPEALRSVADANFFLSELPKYDAYFSDLNQKALSNQSVLRYVGVVDPHGKSSVALQTYPSSHPFASLKGSDNIIAFTTKRFPNPLIVQGAGAGASVTAFGMFSDVLKIAKTIVGPL